MDYRRVGVVDCIGSIEITSMTRIVRKLNQKRYSLGSSVTNLLSIQIEFIKLSVI
jgi:hypothetical protein